MSTWVCLFLRAAVLRENEGKPKGKPKAVWGGAGPLKEHTLKRTHGLPEPCTKSKDHSTSAMLGNHRETQSADLEQSAS